MTAMSRADAGQDRPLLVVQHVPWEGPHLILDSFSDVPVVVRNLLDEPSGAVLPDPSTVRGAVFMGGPMSVNDADALLPLAEEIAWLQRAIALRVPILGICLGAQLLAKAAGATIAAALRPEIGVAPVEITDPHDPLAAHLSPCAHAMHWHGEQFSLPEGAVKLAHSAQTKVQAFRLGGSAWGVLFHLEVDDELLDIWLAEPTMAVQAERALGPDYREQLHARLPAIARSQARAVFDEFAKHCAPRRHNRTPARTNHVTAPTNDAMTRSRTRPAAAGTPTK
jgi:GMP synthase (glutamine-hydrolysing)